MAGQFSVLLAETDPDSVTRSTERRCRVSQFGLNILLLLLLLLLLRTLSVVLMRCGYWSMRNSTTSALPYSTAVCSRVRPALSRAAQSSHQHIIIIIIIIVWIVLEWTLPLPRVTSMQKAKAEMSRIARQANASKLGGQKQKNSLELPFGRPNTPSRQTYSVAAYTCQVTAPSWASEDYYRATLCQRCICRRRACLFATLRYCIKTAKRRIT